MRATSPLQEGGGVVTLALRARAQQGSTEEQQQQQTAGTVALCASMGCSRRGAPRQSDFPALLRPHSSAPEGSGRRAPPEPGERDGANSSDSPKITGAASFLQPARNRTTTTRQRAEVQVQQLRPVTVRRSVRGMSPESVAKELRRNGLERDRLSPLRECAADQSNHPLPSYPRPPSALYFCLVVAPP